MTNISPKVHVERTCTGHGEDEMFENCFVISSGGFCFQQFREKAFQMFYEKGNIVNECSVCFAE